MTQEDKELLLRDLSARLPYGVIVSPIDCGKAKLIGFKDDHPILFDLVSQKEYDKPWEIEYIKPYLRKMSSMTEEERNEWASGSAKLTLDIFKKKVSSEMDIPDASDSAFSIDWLNKKMFAYRTINGKDMFELGIALQASKGMYK